MRTAHLIVALACLTSCSEDRSASLAPIDTGQAEISQPEQHLMGHDVIYCGGETTQANVDLYFANLSLALTETSPESRFNRFVADRFSVRDAQGKELWFDLKDFNSIVPGRITLEEWQRISDRGSDELNPAGYRGCFMDHGKVWFDANEQTGFKLRSIAKDMDWVESETD